MWYKIKRIFKALFGSNPVPSKPVEKNPIDAALETTLPKPLDPIGSDDVRSNYLPIGVITKTNMKSEIDKTVSEILPNKEKYARVEVATGVPWRLIAALHYRESSLNFRGVLHNGEHILGTGKKTRLVPAGRGPFSTWEDAANDALMLKRSIFPKEWNPSACHEFAERFNGLGYRKRGIASPYVWGGTSKYISGHYIADGKFSSSAIDRRLGTAVIMEALSKY